MNGTFLHTMIFPKMGPFVNDATNQGVRWAGVCEKCTFVDISGGSVRFCNIKKTMTFFMNGPKLVGLENKLSRLDIG